MAIKASLLLAFFLLFVGTLARQQQQYQQNQCQINRINALEPYQTIQAEAGVTEFWEHNNQQFQCAGVEFIRHRIQPGGLFLPSYVNTPLLSFTEEGKGVLGVVLPGCPETYEYSSQQQQQQQYSDPSQQRRGSSLNQDRHQKVQNLNEGDVAAIPAGAAHWIYNDGNSELVVVVFFDNQNVANQLDEYHRRFFLAGNPQAQIEQRQGPWEPSRQQGQGQGRGQWQPGHQQGQGQGQGQPGRQQQEQGQGRPGRQQQEQGQGRPGRQQQEQGQGRPGRQQEHPYRNTGNIFNGFDVEFIAEAFNVNRETAEKLQGQRDQRGHIVRVEQQLQIIRPPQSRQEEEQREQRGGRSNGLEETICSLKLTENIDNPSHVDFVNPEAGRLSNLNNYKFPILRHLQLSAARGELHRNAIQSPRWMLNAHDLIYVTHGSLRLQIVNNEGESVFNDELRKGQVVVIPQNYASIKRASEEGARWISFRTNENAITENLSGRVSAIRSLPVDVVANAYQVSREDAQQLKYNQKQTSLFSPSSRSSKRQGWNVLRLNTVKTE